MKDGEALLAAIDIASGRLAQLGGTRPNTENIITHLERDADGKTKGSQAFNCFLITCSQHCAHFCCTAHQSCSFAADHIHVHRHRDILACLKTEIQILTLCNCLHSAVKDSAQTDYKCILYTGVQGIPQYLARQCEHPVASIDGLRYAPELPQCGTVASFGISILYIIVNQGEIVC